MRSTVNILLGFSLIISGLSMVGCAAHTRTKKISVVAQSNRQNIESAEQSLELFRRARFGELSRAQGQGGENWVQSLRPDWVSEQQDIADWNARVAYRKGNTAMVLENLENLHRRSHTNRLLTALLENIDQDAPIRQSNVSQGVMSLELDEAALSVGFPVVKMNMMGREFRMLWDTGATENVLRPEVAEELDLVRSDVQFTVMRQAAGYIVRFATSATDEMALGSWTNKNVPWLVTDLSTMDEIFGKGTARIDGFLSPQLLLRDGCFTIDRSAKRLLLGFGEASCAGMMVSVTSKAPVFTWNGEVYTSARVNASPELAVQIETGSPVTFLRSDASRYLPRGAINGAASAADEDSVNIAHELARRVPFQVAGREVSMTTIDLGASRTSNGHDDIGTLGTDLLLNGNGVVVSFATMEMGILSNSDAVASIQ